MLVLLVGCALVLPDSSFAQSNASIKIVSPADRHNVELGEITVAVEIGGVALSDGYAWQVWLDGEPLGMVRNVTTTRIVVKQPSGPHRLKVELYDGQGKTIASNDILVMAAPVEDHSPVFNQPWFGPAMAVFTVTVLCILILGLRLRPRTTW